MEDAADGAGSRCQPRRLASRRHAGRRRRRRSPIRAAAASCRRFVRRSRPGRAGAVPPAAAPPESKPRPLDPAAVGRAAGRRAERRPYRAEGGQRWSGGRAGGARPRASGQYEAAGGRAQWLLGWRRARRGELAGRAREEEEAGVVGRRPGRWSGGRRGGNAFAIGLLEKVVWGRKQNDCTREAKCLKNESKLRLYWLALKASVIPSDAFLSNNIFDCMLRLVQNAGESEAPFFIDAAACIAKETELIMKLMKQGCKVPHFQCTLSQDIRRCALKVAMFPGKWSPDIAAVLLGIIKEAELILENMKCSNLDAIDTSHKIRRFAIEFLRHKFGEIEQSDEMTSDVDGEVNQPRSTRGTGEVEKNSLEKKCHFMDKQPKKQKTESGLDFLTLLKKGYLTRKTIIATDMCGDKGRMKAFYVPIP